MSVAIRTATRLQDQDDVNVTPAVGVDEYVLTYDHDTAKFVLRAPVAAPDLSGYALLAGRAGGQTLYGGTAANDDITIHGTSDATRTTSYVILQPSGGNVGIGTSVPLYPLHIQHAVEAPQILLQTSLAAGRAGIGFKTSADTGNSYIKTALFFHRYDSNGRGVIGLANNFVADGSNVSYTDMRLFVDRNGYVGVGDFSVTNELPATILHARSSTATTDALRNVLTLGANVTGAGVGAAGLGAGLLFQGETSTTVDSDMAQIGALWTTATHATRASALTFSTLTAGGSLAERMRIDGAGNVGIGTASPTYRLHVAETLTQLTGIKEGSLFITTMSPATDGTGNYRNAEYCLQSGTTKEIGSGTNFLAYQNINSYSPSIVGVNIVSSYGATANIIAEKMLLLSQDTKAGGAALATKYGLYIDSLTHGTTNYAIYTNAGKVRLGDIVNFAGTMGDSAKNPATDAPADWVQVEIGGTPYYIPAYAAS